MNIVSLVCFLVGICLILFIIILSAIKDFKYRKNQKNKMIAHIQERKRTIKL